MRNYPYYLSMAAVVFYNNWVLGLFLRAHATLAGATTSELGATDQPWHTLFRSLDIIAGVLFLLGAGAIVGLTESKKLRALLAVGITALGISTIIESLFFPLQCSSALSHACDLAERTNTVGWRHSFHITESGISYLLMALLPLGVALVMRQRANAYHLKEWSYGLLAYMILWAIESTIRYEHGATAFGYEQRVFIIIFSIWYLLAIRLYRYHQASDRT